MTLKVALIQKSAVPNDPAKNMELGISYLEKAKELGICGITNAVEDVPAMQNHFLMH